MKRTLLFIFLLNLGLMVSSQSVEEIGRAFGSADVNKIAPFISETVDMDICGKGGVLSRGQAAMMLEMFFAKNQISSLEILHSSPFENNKQHVIGEYIAKQGKFTLIYKIDRRGDLLFIRQIRIDKSS
ncbi:MAG: DUF4783 domain-containing protein [Bacteroidetes bacterium]|jgi:hypothetical protein|nr:DUF4783 domain-containing protein [Bacteroidota bacterium]